MKNPIGRRIERKGEKGTIVAFRNDLIWVDLDSGGTIHCYISEVKLLGRVTIYQPE